MQTNPQWDPTAVPESRPVNRGFGGWRRGIATALLSTGLLVVGGTAVVTAASPDPSASPNASTQPSVDGSGSPSESTRPDRGGDGNCPDKGTDGTGDSSGSSS
jgi:hypothetical protein